MRTFLEVEGKMGLILQPTNSQFRPPHLETNPNVRKDKAMEKRKRAAPIKRFSPNTASRPSEAAMHPPVTISKAPINVKSQADLPENRPLPFKDAPVSKSTPWPGAGKMSGNLFQDRNWLLSPNYLNNNSKNATGIASPKHPIKEEPKIGEQLIISPKSRGMWMGTGLSLLQKLGQRRRLGWQPPKQTTIQNTTSARNTKAPSKTP